jgi:hypothetical protein
MQHRRGDYQIGGGRGPKQAENKPVPLVLKLIDRRRGKHFDGQQHRRAKDETRKSPGYSSYEAVCAGVVELVYARCEYCLGLVRGGVGGSLCGTHLD